MDSTEMLETDTTAAATTTFPSREDLQRLRQEVRPKKIGSGIVLEVFLPIDRWNWHAYDYGWRRVALYDYGRVSPIDPGGDWYADRLVDEATRFWQRFYGRTEPPVFAKASHPDAVRTNWQQIPANQLTDSERALALPGIDRMSAEIKANLERFAQPMWRRTITPARRDVPQILGADPSTGDPMYEEWAAAITEDAHRSHPPIPYSD